MSNYSIFSVIGIEIEYMLVDKTTLNIRPISDVLLKELAGQQVNEIVIDDIAVSNELVMHVLELKNNGPSKIGPSMAEPFQKTIKALQPLLDKHDVLLLPTGAHPWMNPLKETQRWPHGNSALYQQFDAIFDCRGHGWSNLQSMHVNLPYSNQDEFCQLHNLIRLILPLLPALAASTPILGGKATGLLDTRLDYYCKNQQRIPSISGPIIPEFITTESDYQQKILAPMYKDISPFDTQGLLQHQWLNSRAAIPKFDVKAIEIRILDSQECVTADIAIAKVIHAILSFWQHGSDYYLNNPYDTTKLKNLFDKAIGKGLDVVVSDRDLLTQWQLPTMPKTFRQIWSLLIENVATCLTPSEQAALELILSQGNLSQRILMATGSDISQHRLVQTYRQLAHCLSNNQLFTA